jgi:hypothetical protein
MGPAARGWRNALLIAAAALGLSGCVAYPAPGYYSYGGYYGAYDGGYYPYYDGPPVVGTVVIGGGDYHHHRHWR